MLDIRAKFFLENKLGMTDYNTCLQTAAATGSAIAAIAAVWVAKHTFTFQKNSLLKKASIEKMLELLQQLYYLKSLIGQAVLGVADEKFTEQEQRISEARDSVKTLEFMISAASSAHLKKIGDCVYDLRQKDFCYPDDSTSNVALRQKLDDAIRALQKIYRTAIK